MPGFVRCLLLSSSPYASERRLPASFDFNRARGIELACLVSAHASKREYYILCQHCRAELCQHETLNTGGAANASPHDFDNPHNNSRAASAAKRLALAFEK
jgi:hypothetical protein